MKLRLISLAAVGATAWAALAFPAAHATSQKTLFADDFTTDAVVSPFNWRAAAGPNPSVATDYMSPGNVRLDSAGLHIITDRMLGGYSDGMLTTTGQFLYGRFDIVARMPQGNGLWPALWLMALDKNNKINGEIDIVEAFGRHPDRFQTTVHDWASGKETPPQCVDVGFAVPGSICAKPPASFPHVDYHAAYHDFGMVWSPSGISFAVDGIPYYSTKWSPSQPMNLILSMNTGTYWDGTPDSTTPFPVSLDVRSVTVRSL